MLMNKQSHHYLKFSHRTFSFLHVEKDNFEQNQGWEGRGNILLQIITRSTKTTITKKGTQQELIFDC